MVKMEYFYGVMSFLVVCALIFDKYEERKANEKRINDVLNRYMSKNYEEFATFEHHRQVLEKKPSKEKVVLREQDTFPVD
jgi:hypothetical protein